MLTSRIGMIRLISLFSLKEAVFMNLALSALRLMLLKTDDVAKPMTRNIIVKVSLILQIYSQLSFQQ